MIFPSSMLPLLAGGRYEGKLFSSDATATATRRIFYFRRAEIVTATVDGELLRLNVADIEITEPDADPRETASWSPQDTGVCEVIIDLALASTNVNDERIRVEGLFFDQAANLYKTGVQPVWGLPTTVHN